jgi:alpha-mannosidase
LNGNWNKKIITLGSIWWLKLNFDIMDLLNNKTINKIGKWMEKNNMFYVPAKVGWKVISLLVGGFNNKAHDIYMIGQSHLDACWVWDWKSTVRKNYNTFSQALEHLEDYPFYTFSCSSPQYYYWMERYYPDKFKKIKEWVDKGRIELVGGMWIEPDLNLVSGESLARQRLYGQRYYLEKFGKISKIGWLSDTFGYCWTLPQILKKSGSDYFYTNKMQWNDTNKWPFVLFYWMGPDGSKVMTYTYSYTVNLLFQDPNLGDFTKMSRFFENPGTFSYKDDFRKIKKLKTKEPLEEFGFVYGIGDGGGGPVRSEVIFFKELLRDGIVKNFITMGQYFRILEKYKDQIPVWNDEMYLEQHRGCYTSHSWLKVANRNAEQLLYKTEILLTLASKFGLNYPRKKIENLYKRLLFNQFHDILPGSAIPKVYEDTKHDFEVINKGCEDLMDSSFNTILNKLETKGNLILFNPLNWSRNDIIKVTHPKKFLIKDMNKKYLITQKIKDDEYIFISPEIPPIGFLDLNIEDTEEKLEFQSDLKIVDEKNEILMENKFIKLIINKETGNIRSLYHKKLKKEILSGEGNEIQVFKEKFGFVGFTAWNIDKNYKNRPTEISLESVSIAEEGPMRIVAAVKKRVNE